MKLANLLKVISGAILAFILALLGIQRSTIKKQKDEIKAKESEVKEAEKKAHTAEQVTEIVKDTLQEQNAIQTQQASNETKIEGADNEAQAIEDINAVISGFNAH